MTVIAMTREMGTLGKEVARIVAERLDLTVIHHEVTSPNDAQGPSEVTRFLEATPEEARRRHGPLDHSGRLTPAQVLALAARGGVLIRGWGAARLLKGLPQVLAVRICAPMDHRIAEIARRLETDTDTARHEIERSDAAHASSVWALFAEDWRSPLHYDLVLNTGHIAVESCAQIVIDAASSPTLAEDAASRTLIADRLVEARIDETLHGPGPLCRRAAHVEGVASQGRVRLYGAVTDGGAAHEIEAAVRRLPGVASVVNEIARIGRYADG